MDKNTVRACPKCGKSEDITKAGLAIRAGGRVQSYRCGCGHKFTEKTQKKKNMVAKIESESEKLTDQCREI